MYYASRSATASGGRCRSQLWVFDWRGIAVGVAVVLLVGLLTRGRIFLWVGNVLKRGGVGGGRPRGGGGEGGARPRGGGGGGEGALLTAGRTRPRLRSTRISQVRSHPNRRYIRRANRDAWRVIRRYPRSRAHRTASRTSRVAIPRSRYSGSVYIESRYGVNGAADPGWGCPGWSHTHPPATTRPAGVTARNPTNSLACIRRRAHARYARSPIACSSGVRGRISSNIFRR